MFVSTEDYACRERLFLLIVFGAMSMLPWRPPGAGSTGQATIALSNSCGDVKLLLGGDGALTLQGTQGGSVKPHKLKQWRQSNRVLMFPDNQISTKMTASLHHLIPHILH
jgi:hypothetical protein